MTITEYPFDVQAEPNTDIWKKPPTHDVFTAPSVPHSKAPLNDFISAEITFSGKYTTQYDQAGLLFTFTKPNADRKWIKTGIEFFDGKPRLSTVCCDSWADWSVAPLPEAVAEKVVTGDENITLRAKYHVDENGKGWWVHWVNDKDGKQEEVPLREIAWIYGDDAGEGWELEVSAAVARPNKDVKGVFTGTFKKFEVEWKKE